MTESKRPPIAARAAADRETSREFMREGGNAVAAASRRERRIERSLSDDAAPAPTASTDAHDDPLFLAAAIVGAAEGFRVRAARTTEGRPSARHPIDLIADASNLMVRRVLLRDRWWTGDSGSLVGFLKAPQPDLNETASGRLLGAPGRSAPPVALLASGGGYTLVDPITGTKSALTDALAERLEPEAYLVYPPLPEGEPSLARLATFALGGARVDLLFVGGLAFLATLAGFTLPIAEGLLIDRALPFARLPLVFELGGAVLAAAMARAAFEFARSSFMLRTATRAAHRLQSALWNRVLRLDASFFRRFAAVDVHDRILAFREIRQRLLGIAFETLVSGLVLSLNLALMFVYSSRLAVYAAGVVVAGSAVVAVLARGLRRIDAARPAAESAARTAAVESLLGIAKLRTAAAEERALARWSARAAAARALNLERRRRDDRLAAFDGAFAMIANLGLLAWSAGIATSGGGDTELSPGGFLAFYVSFGFFTTAALRLAKTTADFGVVRDLWRRVQPLLAAPEEIRERRIDPGELRGGIRIEAATFRYRPDAPPALDTVSLEAAPGECVAIVGASGSGKSTIVRLILGFESPESGQVQFDGKDLATLDVAAVRRQIGVVLQSSRLTEGSIYENIACGRALTLEEARAAAVAAGLEQDLDAMPMGLHTVLSENAVNLSGGQRQRLLIARAVARRPRILLFDEATSALDNRTQAIVGASLARQRATRIVVAHRLSTIRSADRIYVVAAGRIVQSGTFEQLLLEEGAFRTLMRRQTLADDMGPAPTRDISA